MSREEIDRALKSPGLKLMNHVVAGYPSPDASRECIKTMEAAGSDMIEIQIPFSDPMADGSTIVKANHLALAQGMNLSTFWKWLAQVRKETRLPLLLMTYYNIPFRMGLETFFTKAQDTGISGLIIPDILFDNQEEKYLSRMAPFDLHPIQVISPSVQVERLKRIASLGSGFVYTTLKVGITGSKKSHDPGLKFLSTVRKHFSLPIAAGFGIDKVEDAQALEGVADMAVVGSQVIRLLEENYDQNPKSALARVYRFVTDFKNYKTQIHQ